MIEWNGFGGGVAVRDGQNVNLGSGAGRRLSCISKAVMWVSVCRAFLRVGISSQLRTEMK
jgi:hypothetical protein